MSQYVEESMSKRRNTEAATEDVLKMHNEVGAKAPMAELRHGDWIKQARGKMRRRLFTHPSFALLVIFAVLFAGSVFLFESMDILTETIYATKVVVTSLFAVTLGFLLSVWWSSTARSDDKLREATRVDIEYRELLMSFSDSLFDIINALNTLASKPPKPFIIATEFLLGEYVHLLQSRLQHYGDYIAGLGFDATDFLDEKMRIFEGIRERASLSIQGMPKELETAFITNLNLDIAQIADAAAQRQQRLRAKLKELADEGGTETARTSVQPGTAQDAAGQ
jgi:hypothetical protein